MKISIYEGNTIDIECDVTNPDGSAADLGGYTATLTIKKNKSDITALLTGTGTITLNAIVFNIDAASNTLTKGEYYYEITIDDGSDKFTLAQDIFVILESLVY